MRYVVDLRHPLQVPCGDGGSNRSLLLVSLLRLNISLAVEAVECGNPEGISKELRMGLRPTHRDENRFEPVAFTIE